MLEFLNPSTAPAPFSRYSQAVLVPENYRWLHISGQVGCDLQQKLAPDFANQAQLAWQNVVAVLTAGGMSVHDLVKVTILLTRASDIPASRIARDQALQGAAPASTLMVLAALAHPDMLIEVEALAAKAAF
ncbi:MAG TPA: RidA family protein [Terriglobia bacterium]|nr:RidA family protein [Terriglobia bacterium]